MNDINAKSNTYPFVEVVLYSEIVRSIGRVNQSRFSRQMQIFPPNAKPLTCIIDQSLKTGRFPSKLKVANIIPIFKKGDEHDFNNYRPISLLPSISKVVEKTIYSQLFQNLTVNSLLHSNQSGFRAKYLTELALN